VRRGGRFGSLPRGRVVRLPPVNGDDLGPLIEKRGATIDASTLAEMAGIVLVTGASSGIGEATVLHLRELGFEPVAGVRREEDAERLRSQGLRTVMLDVTDEAQIAAARGELGGGALAGLVNNAGVAVAAPLEFLPIDQLRRQLEINLVGQVAVTQAFLPALRRAGGRIVNVSSIGGRVALPLVSPYNASKFALEGVSDSLRRELRAQGVDVIVIEPGGVRTPIWGKGNELAASMMAAMPPEAERLYGRMVEAMRREIAKIERERGLPPRAVAEVIGRALTVSRPRTRYVVGSNAKLRARMAAVLPDRVMDRLIGRSLGG
jgi:NAD(P)-dependent dehydrogenase (short-subunit alcohol dehydrogenase family)